MQTPDFISVKGTSFVFNKDGWFKFFVPEKYFGGRIAKFVGENISLFGVIPYAIFDKNDKPVGKLRTFKYPISFLTHPDEIDTVKNLTLTKNNAPEDYKVLKYRKGGVIVVNYNIAEDSDNIETWYSAIDTGSLPINIPYNEIQDYFMQNCLLTGNNYKVSLQLIGVVISELCRSKKDISKPFRLEDNPDMNAYQWISIKDVPRDVSPFTALTQEEWDKAVISSITTKNSKESPIEKIMMD